MKFKSPYLVLVIALATLASCSRPAHLCHKDWAPDVREGLNDLMDYCAGSESRQYAVFDFDNTSSIFDVTENEMYYQILTMAFAMNPDTMERIFTKGLAGEEGLYDAYIADIRSSYGSLYDNYGPFTYKGLDEAKMAEVKEDPQWEEFASKLCNLYSYIYHTASPTVAYNWTKFWCYGMTEPEEFDLASRTLDFCTGMETVKDSWEGKVESGMGPMSYTYTLGFCVPEPIIELWKTLSANGIDVWVCSASGTVAVLAAIERYGLKPYCKGVLSMTMKLDAEGRLSDEYNYDGQASVPTADGWKLDGPSTGAQTCGQGKVTAIRNAIAPFYEGRGPVAGFMDSTGDFNFCTEFADTRAVVCFNRGNRKVTDGGGLIGETAIYERDVLGYDFKKAGEAGDILFLLQGRDENGLRRLRPSNASLTLGSSEEKLFAGEENYAQYKAMCDDSMSVRSIINTFSSKFLSEYPGYRSITGTPAEEELSDSPDFEDTGLECTSIVVGREASGTGSVITSHTCDGVSHTWVNIVPARDHKAGEMTAIRKNWRKTRFPEDTVGVKIVGAIPQVAHTYAYVNTGYPSLNEKQLGIGETTFGGPDTLINRNSIFVIEELCRLALERCDNARDAIRLMGSLAEEYGYGDSGECLTVADKNEVWLFEITGNGKHNTGAIWAAQRVPDGHVGISANITRIGRIDRSDSEYFMASDNVEEVTRAHGLWDGESEFVFWKAVKCDYAKGKNFREREFIVLSQIAPSLGLTFDMDEIPFSVKPDSTVSARRVMEILRGTYEGTDFDMCKDWLIDVAAKDGVPAHKEISPVANPWLTNDTRNTLNTIAPGVIEFRRTLAVAWCAYSTVIELRRDLPDAVGGVCWYAVDNPAQSPHIPIFSGSTTLPDAFSRCGHKQYDPDCVLWQFRRANKLATLAWQKTKKDFNATVDSFDDYAFNKLSETENAYMSARNDRKKTAVLNDCTADVHAEAVGIWKDMEAKYWSMFGRGF